MTTRETYRQIGIIGTGRVARAMALALRPHGAAPPLMWGRSSDGLRAAIEQTGAAPSPELDRVAKACDAIVVAVADDALDRVVAQLAGAAPFTHAPLVFHVSGRSGVDTLASLHGAVTAAIHPAMTFTGDPPGEVQRMVGARFAITGSSQQANERAIELVHLLGGVPVAVAQEHRALYHAALCHAANHLVTLLADASHALSVAGVEAPTSLLAPLVRAALDNSLEHGFAALSGPLLRGDGMTLRDHLTALDRHCPQMKPAYRAMALATLDAMERHGKPSHSGLKAMLDLPVSSHD